MHDRPPVVALRESLLDLVASHPMRVDEDRQRVYRERIWAVVDDLRDAGWPPERVIVAVKQVADDVGLSTSRGLTVVGAPLTEQDAFIVSMVRWCIERYFNAPSVRTRLDHPSMGEGLVDDRGQPEVEG